MDAALRQLWDTDFSLPAPFTCLEASGPIVPHFSKLLVACATPGRGIQ